MTTATNTGVAAMLCLARRRVEPLDPDPLTNPDAGTFHNLKVDGAPPSVTIELSPGPAETRAYLPSSGRSRRGGRGRPAARRRKGSKR